MASVIKMFSNFKSNHLHGGKRSPSTKAATPVKDTPREDPEGAATNDIMNRRRVSISKSGRYKENHKRRSALLEDTKKSESASSPKDSDRQEVLVRDKDKKNKENEINKENEKNILNSVRRESAISVTDGHAVADEIESLANTLTTENGAKTDLALT